MQGQRHDSFSNILSSPLQRQRDRTWRPETVLGRSTAGRDRASLLPLLLLLLYLPLLAMKHVTWQPFPACWPSQASGYHRISSPGSATSKVRVSWRSPAFFWCLPSEAACEEAPGFALRWPHDCRQRRTSTAAAFSCHNGFNDPSLSGHVNLDNAMAKKLAPGPSPGPSC